MIEANSLPEISKTPRRSFQFSLRTMLIGLAILAALAAVLSSYLKPDFSAPSIPDPDRTIKEIEITITIHLHEQPVRLHIIDPNLIQSLVVKPMRNARPVPLAEDIALGRLMIHYEDGSEAASTMFFPWGRFSSDRRTWVTNFSPLQAECHQMLR